ncbi:hypothetical protein IWQ56_001060, partial [Coemansia nantahalensis]
DTVLELIEKLPNLIKLTFYNLDFSDIQTDIEQHSLDTAVTVVRHMLLRIPTLAHLLAVQTPRSPVLSFVEAYAPCYPHMGGVKLELDDGRTNYANDPFARSPNVEEPADVDVVTNLDLIAMVGCARAVRRVYIDVFCLVNPFPGWHEVIQRMRAVAKEWRAEELTIAIGPDLRHYDDNTVDMAEYTDDIVEVADALAALMPDVRRLDLDEANRSQISRSLYGRLASHYADQLQWFDTQYPITVPRGFQFTRLKKAVISYNGAADYQLPQMAIGELVRSLDITSTQDICPLLEYAVLPPRMESICIRMRSDSYQDIANVALPATRCLSLQITPESFGDPSGLPAINRILDNARGSEAVWLIVEDERLPVTPESITCTAPTHLAISALIGVDTMLALITKLPNLAQVCFHNLDMRDIQADISIPGADEDVAVEPPSMSLTSLVMGYDTRMHSPDMGVAVATYMLVAIPTLVKLHAPLTPEGPVVQFVEAYAPRYPHLRSVKLTLWSS